MIPLSERVRPKNLSQFIGQEHLVDQENIIDSNKPINTMLLSKTLYSMIFYGPPATGKTTLANIIADSLGYTFVKTDAITLNTKKLNEILNKNDLLSVNKKVLFIDEFHRMNKPKQDMLLNPLEKGEIIIIGATTENPFFVLQRALRSRLLVYEFKELSEIQIIKVIKNALTNDVLLKKLQISLSDETIKYLVFKAKDVRKSLNVLELIIIAKINNIVNDIVNNVVNNIVEKNKIINSKIVEQDKFLKNNNISKSNNVNKSNNVSEQNKYFENKRIYDLNEILSFIAYSDRVIKDKSNFFEEVAKTIENSMIKIENKDVDLFLQNQETLYSNVEEHFNVISAFIKSIRGSDIDAALYYLAMMLESGEDPVFIARRLIILAAEDISLAYPNALVIAVSGLEAVERIGMPEARIILAEITALFAGLPKSNSSYIAYEKVSSLIKEGKIIKIPDYLKGGGYKLYKKNFNSLDKTQNGNKVIDNKNIENDKNNIEQNYKYPHDFKYHYVKQKYLSEDLDIFHFTEQGFEKSLKQWIEKIKKS